MPWISIENPAIFWWITSVLRASSSFRFFRGPMASKAVLFAARFRNVSSSSSWSWNNEKGNLVPRLFVLTLVRGCEKGNLVGAHCGLERWEKQHWSSRFLASREGGGMTVGIGKGNILLPLLPHWGVPFHPMSHGTPTCFAFSFNLACSGSSCLERLYNADIKSVK